MWKEGLVDVAIIMVGVDDDGDVPELETIPIMKWRVHFGYRRNV